MKDVVIVGAGLAGLSAAWRLRHWDVQLLEANHRVGGRVRSEKRGQYWLNWGGHMYAGAGSSTAELFGETGTASIKIPGVLAGMSLNGKTLSSGPIQTYPLRFPMPLKSRLQVFTKGAKISKDLVRYARVVATRPGETGAVRQQRIYDFENDRTFADYVGALEEDTAAFFLPTVTRSSADFDQISAGAGIGYFSLIWNIGAGLDRYILGGPSTLTETIAETLRDRIELEAEVHEVVQNSDHVVVRYRRGDEEFEIKARTAVLATPAPITHRIAVNLRPELREALSKIVYGPLVSGAFLTNETTPQAWDHVYGTAAGKKSFVVALNSGNIVRGRETVRQPGGSMMTFSAANQARELLDLPNEEVVERYTRDLDAIYPGFADYIVEAEVAKFPLGSPYCFPGRGKLQPELTRPSERVFLAGDYLGTLYTETSITSGFTAAQEAASLLATQMQRGDGSVKDHLLRG